MRHFIAGIVMVFSCFGFLNPVLAESLFGLVNPALRVESSDHLDGVISAHSFDASEYISVWHYGDPWREPYTPREGTNLAISFARTDISLGYKSWSIGVFRRQEMYIAGSKGVTDLYFDNMNHIQAPVGRRYDINLDATGFVARGVRLDKAAILKSGEELQVTTGIGVSLLLGQRARMVQAQGSAMVTLGGYDYSASLNDADSRKTFPFMPQGETTGRGYAIDGGMIMKWQDGKQIELAINDLASEIVWVNLPTSKMSVNSATIARDSQGYAIFNPTLTGVNSRGEITQRLNTKAQIQLALPLTANVTASLGTEWMRNFYFPRVELSYLSPYDVKLTTGYDTRFNTYGLDVAWKRLHFGARTQSLNFEQSRGRGLEAGWVSNF